MPTVTKTWKPRQSFPNGDTVLGSDTFAPMSGVVTIEVNRSEIPVGGILKLSVQSRLNAEDPWKDEFAIEVKMDGNANKDGTFVSRMIQPFNFVVSTELRAVANVTNGPFPFGVKAVASW